MNEIQSPGSEMYYTSRHEWIRFQDNAAFIGISKFRVASEKLVKDIAFVKIFGYKEKGTLLATIQFKYHTLQVYMPVAGKIININNKELLINQNLLLTDAEAGGWLVKISLEDNPGGMGLLAMEDYIAHYPEIKSKNI